ncbi:hypothetical protein TNIN_292491 [Trichonephila inaurata madagascariensis]|uniref:Uncharacterized protein n=1 Tax=Trichonephila inaurata madagascariensis TaxID=2747483 RepID=A0A8X6XEL4_9ARAC|nr:hypothetical protein TNIN_292491 [Trichonephila inaurata madagascariensis]
MAPRNSVVVSVDGTWKTCGHIYLDIGCTLIWSKTRKFPTDMGHVLLLQGCDCYEVQSLDQNIVHFWLKRNNLYKKPCRSAGGMEILGQKFFDQNKNKVSVHNNTVNGSTFSPQRHATKSSFLK